MNNIDTLDRQILRVLTKMLVHPMQKWPKTLV